MFPVPLSEKQNLSLFAVKLCEKATLCCSYENSEICSLVAGYTDNVPDNKAYISVVASLPSAQGNGYASALVKEFINISKRKGLGAVHLYAVESNTPAIRMYEKLGFERLAMENEPRPDDVHLIYYIDKEKL